MRLAIQETAPGTEQRPLSFGRVIHLLLRPICNRSWQRFLSILRRPPSFGQRRSMLAGLVRPRSRGYLRVAGPNPTDTIEIVANTLAGSADMKALIRAIELCREIGNSSAMSPFAKREVMPGNQTAGELESFARNAVSNFWHQACTAKMGRDEISVVDSQLRVYRVDCLRIPDASLLPPHP